MGQGWMWHPAPQGITLEKLFRPKDKFCFLAGSGISLDSPSCLPTGYQFTKALLEHLIPQEEQLEVLTLMNPERENMRDPGDFLRFEQLMEYLSVVDPELRILNSYAECTEHNFNHQFLAQMLQRKHQVLTTNFDSLIEYALLKAQIPLKQILPVIHKQDWKPRSKHDQYQIYKLHGSLVDVRSNQDCRDSLQVTLRRIAEGKYMVFELEYWKREVIQKLLKKYDLIVLGYSGLDDFDVLPTLWNVASRKRLLWISHEADYSIDQASIEVVQRCKSVTCSQYDRIDQYLLNFTQYKTRKLARLFRIKVNTGELLKWLWQRYLHHPPIRSTEPCSKLKFSIPEHLMSEEEQWMLLGRIFADRHLPEKSIQALKMGLSLNQDTSLKRVFLNNIGTGLKDQGRLDEAMDYFQQALQLQEQIGDLKGKVITLNHIGLVLKDQGQLDEALNHFQQVLEIIDQQELYKIQRQLKGFSWLPRSQVIAYINMASVFECQGKWDEVFSYGWRAARAAETLGDLYLRAKSKNIIGVAVHKTGGNLVHLQEALEIAQHLGDLQLKASVLDNMGTAFREEGRLDEALEHYQQAHQINQQLGDLNNEAICLNNIGKLTEDQGQLDEALEHYQQALNITERLGDMDRQEQIQNALKRIKYQLQQSH
ncbi:MAG: tetratricopeptide repeat protein [Candidatus Hodarchaeota archaeon]